jgi:hypothetical protein
MRAPFATSIMLACSVMMASSLTEQSIALLLDRSFSEPELSYILLDSGSGRLICSRWREAEQPVPVGSLVKPFTALAYGSTHGFVFPQYRCRGAQDHCWLPQGHGRIGLAEAIAHSCNAYFLALAAEVDSDRIYSVAQRFGLKPPERDAGSAAYIGIGDQWLIPPISMARAYNEIVARPDEPGVREIMRGMSLSASEGTGSGAGAGAFAKTGTALCMHRPRHTGDGYTVVVFPAESPRFTLLVRVDGVPGAEAAFKAGRMRAVLESGHK